MLELRNNQKLHYLIFRSCRRNNWSSCPCHWVHSFQNLRYCSLDIGFEGHVDEQACGVSMGWHFVELSAVHVLAWTRSFAYVLRVRDMSSASVLELFPLLWFQRNFQQFSLTSLPVLPLCGSLVPLSLSHMWFFDCFTLPSEALWSFNAIIRWCVKLVARNCSRFLMACVVFLTAEPLPP